MYLAWSALVILFPVFGMLVQNIIKLVEYLSLIAAG
jgi:hypothetical protein